MDVSSQNISRGSGENLETVRVAGDPVDVQTAHLRNKCLEHYHYEIPFGCKVFVHRVSLNV